MQIESSRQKQQRDRSELVFTGRTRPERHAARWLPTRADARPTRPFDARGPLAFALRVAELRRSGRPERDGADGCRTVCGHNVSRATCATLHSGVGGGCNCRPEDHRTAATAAVGRQPVRADWVQRVRWMRDARGGAATRAAADCSLERAAHRSDPPVARRWRRQRWLRSGSEAGRARWGGRCGLQIRRLGERWGGYSWRRRAHTRTRHRAFGGGRARAGARAARAEIRAGGGGARLHERVLVGCAPGRAAGHSFSRAAARFQTKQSSICIFPRAHRTGAQLPSHEVDWGATVRVPRSLRLWGRRFAVERSTCVRHERCATFAAEGCVDHPSMLNLYCTRTFTVINQTLNYCDCFIF